MPLRGGGVRGRFLDVDGGTAVRVVTAVEAEVPSSSATLRFRSHLELRW